MIVKNGKAIFEEIPCEHCKETGKEKVFKLCPNSGKRIKRNPCPICKAQNSFSNHNNIGRGLKECFKCKGKGKYLEDRYDFDSNHVLLSIPFEVIDTQRNQTLNESLYGFNCIVSVTDYGRHKNLTDKELIDKVKEDISKSSLNQYNKFVDESNNIANKIIIKRNAQGYSLVSSYN